MSETARYRHITRKYCLLPNGEPGCGVDLASGGDPVIPSAWQLELPHDQYDYYNAHTLIRGPVQLRADAFTHRASEADSLDFCYVSHLLEDRPQEQWPGIFARWASMLKPGGYLIILVPERTRWEAALARGQSPNCSHAGPEPAVGDMSVAAIAAGLEVVEDRLTNLDENDYTILGVFRRK
jgi:SAM-dependent methyltransferase